MNCIVLIMLNDQLFQNNSKKFVKLTIINKYWQLNKKTYKKIMKSEIKENKYCNNFYNN